MKTISLLNLLYMLIPLLIVWYFYKRWIKNQVEIIYATIRMLSQLLLIGYVLIYIFKEKDLLLGAFIIIFMITLSTWISFRNIQNKSIYEYFQIFTAISISGIIHLIIMLYFVLELENIYEPQFVIPIAGMIFANTMNGLSLAIERFESEILKTNDFNHARQISFKTAMIPQINSFLAVGLVSLPGMMTGQILSGIDPLIAVRYQIMIMLSMLSGTGISIIVYFLLKNKSIH
ncbi:MAG: ABC transporter permease [Poseidonibacter sp.]|uniref:ABC transporter permease n=1 Tax=Poseidonibacter sp. TaxID=2321188 RepID=UPI00359E0710